MTFEPANAEFFSRFFWRVAKIF